MIKSLLPIYCPACGFKLTIEKGDKDDILKLMCKNPNCFGSALKKLQKGIIALEIKALGPKIIEKLFNAGIISSIDLFNPDKFNEKVLIESGEFQKGRALEKIITSVKSTKSIPIHKAILSLQLDKIGRTFSEKIAQKLSGLPYDFSGLELDIREKLEDENSELNKIIKESLEMFKKYGVEIKYMESPKLVSVSDIKKITKKVAIEQKATQEIKDIIAKLDWEIVPVCAEGCDFLIVEDKNNIENFDLIKQIGVKIMTIKQIKLLFL
ncbi:MAG: hypothetical protein HPY57_14500 [Ignavibacteria bacterium]|nr:hypothetical protein [Ignavibacteria bacterium]